LNSARRWRGFTLFFTGLSGAGKSTIARGVLPQIAQRTNLSVTLLDGDEVRQRVSSDLGFSKADRDTNIRRIAALASEINANDGVAICALIAPYAQARREARATIEQVAPFIEVHVATPIDVCEARDTKRLYAKARAGEIVAFTGVDDPYEVPESPDLRVDTSRLTEAQAVTEVMRLLERLDVLG